MAQYHKAPVQMAMGRPEVDRMFASFDALLVKQTPHNMISCEAESEFKMSPFEWGQVDGDDEVVPKALQTPNVMYALQASTCCCQGCWRDGRPFDIELSVGGERGGSRFASFNKPCGCPLVFFYELDCPCCCQIMDCPCCCLLPRTTSMWLSKGKSAGSESEYLCHLRPCVPRIQYSENGSPVYILQQQTCCGGCCTASEPFYFHDPNTMEVVGGDYAGPTTPQIREVSTGFTGFKEECCTIANNYALFFPLGSSTERKLGLLGLTYLLEFSNRY